MSRLWLFLGAVSGGLAVGLAAWAAHGLAPEVAARVQSALTMQGWHALALLAVGLLAERRRGPLPHLAGLCFLLGQIGFAGAIWWRALQGTSLFAGLAPTGGMLLMAGWLLLALAGLKRA